MPGDLQPLALNFQIVDQRGFPTPYFIKWAQQRQIDITAGITAAQAQTLIDDWAAARSIIAGAGLTGGGTLAANRTIDVNPGTGITVAGDAVGLTNTAVTPGSYGDATHVGQFTVDAQGRVTAAANVAISGGGGGTTPALVQVKSAIGATSAVTLAAAPTAANMLLAIATHWNTLSVTAYANAGWVPLDINNGASTDGYMLAMKYALPGESATQTPFAASAGGMSTSIFEVSGGLVAIPVVRGIKSEITASPIVVPLVSPKASSLLVGVSAEGGSNAAFTVTSGVTLTLLENITGTTASNTPRRTQTFSSAGIALATTTSFTTTFTAGNFVSIGVMIVGS